jgi:hypothetical protein
MMAISRCAAASLVIFGVSSSAIAADADYSKELQVFYTMVAELRLENGAATPLTSDRAIALVETCETPRLADAKRSGSAMAETIWWGCHTIAQNYFASVPITMTCSNLVKTQGSVSKLEAAYASERPRFLVAFNQLRNGLGCNGNQLPPVIEEEKGADLSFLKRAPVVEWPIYEGAITIDIKPLPPRPVRRP